MPRKLRVVVADDAPTIRLICRINLEAEGMLVEEAADGEEALAAIAAHPPHVAVLDVMMPGIDGWELARRLRAQPHTADLPLIFLTAVDQHDAEARAAAFRGSYLPKPFSPIELPQAVRRALLT